MKFVGLHKKKGRQLCVLPAVTCGVTYVGNGQRLKNFYIRNFRCL